MERDIVSIRGAAARSKEEGNGISEYAIRQWVRLGLIPTRKTGVKHLLSYSALMRFVRCESGQDNSPPTTQQGNHYGRC